MRLSYKLRGRTVQQSLADPAEHHKAEREIAEFRRFQQLSADLVAVNERICHLRPVDVKFLSRGHNSCQPVRRYPYTAIDDATRIRAVVFDYIVVLYNRTRWHSHIGDVRPDAFEGASRHAL